MLEYPIKVNYSYTNNIDKAKEWLESLPDLFAADFETASKFTKEQVEQFKEELKNNELLFLDKIKLEQKIKANGLSHPSLAVITHLSIGWSDRDSHVIICDNDEIRKIVFNFLVTTNKQQLWHNCGLTNFIK